MSEPDHRKYRLLTQAWFQPKTLCENPDQLDLLQHDWSLIPNLAEEAVRWTPPIHPFTRIAARDFDSVANRCAKGIGWCCRFRPAIATRTVTNFVGGPKSVPIRFSV